MLMLSASVPSSNPTFIWFEIISRATVQTLVVLAVISLFWLAMRRHISHAFAHGLFLLVPARFALVLVCGLLALELPIEIPLPFISATAFSHAVCDERSNVIITPDTDAMQVVEHPTTVSETGPEYADSRFVPTQVETASSPPVTPSNSYQVESTSSPRFEWSDPFAIAFCAWFLICSILAVRFTLLTLAMHFRLKLSSQSPPPWISAHVAEVADAIGLSRSPSVIMTTAVASPAVLGLIRSKLLIPTGFEIAFNETETRWAIAHELAHLKRRDLWVVAFERCVGLAGFFHPALWLARRATANFRELACDDLAGKVTGLPPRRCAETFLKIIVWADRQVDRSSGKTLVLGVNPRFPTISRRIENMMDQATSKPKIPRWLWCASPLLVALVLLPVSPRFIAATETPVNENQNLLANEKTPFEIQAIDAATGQPVVSAMVHYLTDRTGGKIATDANGKARIPFEPGEDDNISFRIASDAYVPFRLSRSAIQDPDFPPVSPLIAKLQPGMAIGGQVVDEKGESVADARVLVTFQAKANELGSTSYRCELVRTGADGRWKTAQVDPKATRIDVAALHPSFAIDWDGTETDPRGRVEPPFENLKSATHMFRIKRDQIFTGRVLDLDGKPVAGAEVRHDEWPVEFGDDPLLTDAKGEFRIGDLGTVRAPVKIAVHKPGQGWCVKSIDVQDQDRVATFQLIPGRSLSGRVTDTAGKPVANVRVDDTMLPRSLATLNEIRRTDADGRFKIADAPADFISLFFSKTGYSGYEAKIDTVQSGTVEVVLKKQNVVEGRVTDAATGQPVGEYQLCYLTRFADGERGLSVHGRHVEGRFRFPASPFRSRDGFTHDYRLRIEAPGYQTITTDLMKVDDLPKSLNFGLKKIDLADPKSIEGRVLKPDGTPAAGAAVGYFTPKEGEWPRYRPQFAKDRLTGMLKSTSAVVQPMKVEFIRTDADGTFRIPTDVTKLGWVVTHDSGAFRSTEAGAVKPGEPIAIKLGPYARIQGVFVRDGKPQAKVPVWYSGPAFGLPVPLQDSVMTDEQGRFEIPDFVPGTLRLAFPHEKLKGLWQFLAEPFDVPVGASLRVETSVTEFGHHQVVSEASGKELARTGSGAFGKTFAVYGRATDAVTGKLLTKTRALFFTGQPGDDSTPYVQWVGLNDGHFTAYHAISNLSVQETQKIAPYLVVFAPGYEPFVSNQPIPRGNEPIRMDVALKPAPAGELRETVGQILRADGTPAKHAEIAFTTKTPILKVGQAKVRWQIFVQPGSKEIDGPYPVQTDEQGRFRFSTTEAIDQLTVTDSSGCAVISSDELAKSQGVVRLGPWARVEGRADVKQPAEGQVWARVQYRNVAWKPMTSPPGGALRPDGTFVIEQVLPGKHMINLMLHKQIDQNSWSFGELEPPARVVPVETTGGNTARVTILQKPAQPDRPAETKAATNSKPVETPKSSEAAKTAATERPAAPPKPTFPTPTSKFITGKVLKPDGTPAAGAEVGFFTTTDDRNDRFLPRLSREGRIEAIEHRAIVRGQWNNREREPIRTDANGRFRLPVWAERFGWCITHDTGVLRSTKLVEKAEGETELKLEPWGRIEGRLLLDERPMASKTLVYQPNFDIGKNRFGNPMPTSIRTNHPGMFVVERALPGPYRFAFPDPATSGGEHQYPDHDLTVPSGGTLKFDVNLTMYGWEERLMDTSGKVFDRKTYGATEPGFRVYGQAIDTDTGVPVEPMSAWLVTGRKDDPLEIVADERPGSVFAVDFIMKAKGPNDLGQIDPYLVVIAPGYEPFVSAERVKRGDSPVRHDVRLKKLPPQKMLTIEGQVLDPDGKTPRMAFYRNDVPGEPVRVGETTFAWKFNTENPPFSIDRGRFKFTVRNSPGKLLFSNQLGFAQVEAAEFSKLPGGVVRLEPWGKVRLKILRNGRPDNDYRITWDHREGWKFAFMTSASLYPADDGSILMDRLPPLPVEIEIRSSSNPNYRYFHKSVTLEAKAGQTTDVDVLVTDEELKEAEAILKSRQAGN